MKPAIGFALAVLLVAAAAAGWLNGRADVVVTAPVPLSDPAPFRYPIDLWDRGAEGETVLLVHVTETGGVDSAYVVLSSGEAAFDSAALAGAAVLRFAPGRRDDARVATWVRLPVRFRISADSAMKEDG